MAMNLASRSENPHRLLPVFPAGEIAAVLLTLALLALLLACGGTAATEPAERVDLTPPLSTDAAAVVPTDSPLPPTLPIVRPAPTPEASPEPRITPAPPPAPVDDGSKTLVRVVHPATRFVQLSGGYGTFCGLQQDGRVLCWDTRYPFGLANKVKRAVEGEFFRQITVGGQFFGGGFFCGIRNDNTIQCVGSNRYGELRYPAGQFRSVHAGKNHACALDEQGGAVCWGRDKGGRATPPEGYRFARIDGGGVHSCGLGYRGDLNCWGIAVTESGPFQSLSLGRNSVCALRNDGTVWCWGRDTEGWFGSGDGVFTQIAVGEWHACGLDGAGAARCWGPGGIESGGPSGRFIAISAGWYDTCGLRPEGYAECWKSSDLNLPPYGIPRAELPADISAAFAGRVFEQPVELLPWPDGAMAVVERKGVISAYTAAGVERPIVDLAAQTSRDSNEFGMLSAALDPEFDRFPFLYIYYNHKPPGDDGVLGSGAIERVTARLSRFPVVNGLAVAERELVMLELSERGVIHQGGAIRFGPDGMLYLGLGDNATPSNSQDMTTLNGKIIRIDVRGATAEQPYRIPDDNPFAATPGVRAEIWAYGLRNPWRMSFDGQGRLWVGDAGQAEREEVSMAAAGANLGWPIFEGSICHGGDDICAASDDAVAPAVEYDHSLGCAITGVTANSRYAGTVIFSDLCSGRVWALAGATEQADTTAPAGIRLAAGWQVRELLHIAKPILSINTDADGNVYLLTAGNPIFRVQWEQWGDGGFRLAPE